MSDAAAIKIAFSVADKGWDKALPEAAKVARAAARRTIKAALDSAVVSGGTITIGDLMELL